MSGFLGMTLFESIVVVQLCVVLLFLWNLDRQLAKQKQFVFELWLWLVKDDKLDY